MRGLRNGLFFFMLLVFALSALGSKCGKERSRAMEDPLWEKAREKYAEGRRLFLTCDPNNYPKALQLFEDALAYREDYPEALAAWAETASMWLGFYMTEEVFEKGYTYAQRAIRLNPQLDMGYRAMADLFRHHRDEKTGELQNEYALEVIERAIKLNPNSAENLYVQGSIYLAEDPEKALRILLQAARINPALGKLYFNIAAAYQMLANKMKSELARQNGEPEELEQKKQQIEKFYDDAVAALKKYQRLVPGDLAGYYALGTIYVQRGDLDQAEELFKKTVSVNRNPDASQNIWRIKAYNDLAKIELSKNNDPQAARLYLEQAYQLAPRNQGTLQELIRVCKLLKDEQAAARYQKELEEAEKKAAQAQIEAKKKLEAARKRARGRTSPSPPTGEGEQKESKTGQEEKSAGR